MSNSPQLGQWRPDPREDLGLGRCYRCIQFMAIAVVSNDQKKLAGFVPNFACNLAPWPMPDGQVVALPACYPCQIGEGKAGEPGAGAGLIRVNGKVPGL